MKPEIENCQIDGTYLGVEDHGIFTFMLDLKGDCWGQGFGGYGLDEPQHDAAGKFLGRIGTAYGCEAIRKLLETLEVPKWEMLPGTHVRIRRDPQRGTIKAIGHIFKERWLDLAELAASFGIPE